ncbi:MAG: hypothetical protein GXY67_04050 [Clostridiales bacterium]|nr:hypothetical protein [Clostridiales bacterium]
MKRTGLPYINNAKAVLLTASVNLAIVFLLYWPDGISYRGVLWDSLICAAITTAIDLWVVFVQLLKLRWGGQIPTQVPVSPFMQRLPSNPFLLGVLFTTVFGMLAVGANAAILWFFERQHLAFVPWLAYKLVYSTILSVIITEYCVFRYVQPDWVDARVASSGSQIVLKPVRNPLPKVSLLKEVYASVTGNLATNMIAGLAFGGVAIASDGSVFITPTTVEGVPISGLIFGLIVGVLVTRSVLQEIRRQIPVADLPDSQPLTLDKRFTWMPKGNVTLTLFVCVCMMVFSSVALWALMKLFDLPVMNVYQYAVFITVYASIVSKLLSYVLVRRCTQPDYLRYMQKRGKGQSVDCSPV